MEKTTLLTAVGRLIRRGTGSGYSCPVIIISEKEYMVDMQELVIWTQLNWRFLKREDLKGYCDKAFHAIGYTGQRSYEECVERLLTRGLVVLGTGDTDYDALYDLLCNLYIIPVSGNTLLRTFSFMKAVLLKRVPVKKAGKLFEHDKRTDQEKTVMKLAVQALLSTAEIIQCVEKNITRLPDPESILDGIYSDEETTSENIGFIARSSRSCRPITVAVANLYLRQQIIFERI